MHTPQIIAMATAQRSVSVQVFGSDCLFISVWLLGNEESEDEEYGNVHIIELHKGEEPLGIHLTHFTGPDGV